MGATDERTAEGAGALRFQHRPSESRLIERVWRSRSRDTTTMTSVARAQWDVVFWEGPDGRHAGVQGPESTASQAPVPAGAAFLGVRLALGTFLPALPTVGLVDRFVELPLDGRWLHLGGARLPVPRYEDAEAFVALLVRQELLLVADAHDGSVSERTRQRRHRAATGLPQGTVRQIERAHDAALRLQAGEAPASVAQDAGYFDQPHLARSLRRFIGPTASELAAGEEPGRPLSLLYKTETADGR
ncbi:AraC family transcriptional regulator [Leifsonia sp. ku-ls]|nr:AraC family transcriptional regulator [Leifsonia sp. ku-ls]